MNCEKVYDRGIFRNLNTISRAAMIELASDRIEVIRFISHEKQLKILAKKNRTN